MQKSILKKIISLAMAFFLVISAIPLIATDASATEYTGCLSQHDSRWGSYNVNGGTISATGCGILSLVNAVGYLTGMQMDVIDTALWAYRIGAFNPGGAEGTYRTAMYCRVEAVYGETYGITLDCDTSGEGYWESASSTRLKNHLLKGGVAVGHVYNHFIAIVGYNATTNKYHLYDSSAAAHRGTNYNNGDVWVTEAAFSTGTLDLDWFCLISSTRSKETWIEKACFDVMVYRDRNKDLAGMTDDQLKEHWLKHGIKEGRPSSTILDLGFYLNNNPDLKKEFGTDYEKVYQHFITKGYKEYRKSSALFDGSYYTNKYPDVASSFKEEYLRHYVENGQAEGRRASLTFDPNYYWHLLPDVYEAWPNDYTMCARHYAGHGINAQIEAYDHEYPVISDVTVSDITATGYTVSCKVTDNWGIDKVVFPTWTVLNDQDDLANNFMNTQKGTKNGDTYTFTVNASDHNNEVGQYITHIYAFDKGGNRVQLVLDVVDVKDPIEEEPVIPDAPALDKITLTGTASYATDGTYLKNVTPDTIVQSLLTQFENEVLEVLDRNGHPITGSAKVGTGATVNLYNGGTLLDSVTVVVLGDVDGNGIIDTTDVVRVKAAFLGTFDLSEAENKAADVDKNGIIDTTDYVRVKSHFLGTFVIA
jgi:hypothetical protein